MVEDNDGTAPTESQLESIGIRTDGTTSYSYRRYDQNQQWEFTQLNLWQSTAHTRPIAGVVYSATHDEQTRARVMQWLADTYDVPSTF